MADKELYKGQLKDLQQISSLKTQIIRSEEIIARTSGIVKSNQQASKKLNEDILKLKGIKECPWNDVGSCDYDIIDNFINIIGDDLRNYINPKIENE